MKEKTKKCKHHYGFIEKEAIRHYQASSDFSLSCEVHMVGYKYEFHCIFCLKIKTVVKKIKN